MTRRKCLNFLTITKIFFEILTVFPFFLVKPTKKLFTYLILNKIKDYLFERNAEEDKKRKFYDNKLWFSLN